MQIYCNHLVSQILRSVPMPAAGTATDSRLLSTMPSFDMSAIKKKTVAFFKNHDVSLEHS